MEKRYGTRFISPQKKSDDRYTKTGNRRDSGMSSGTTIFREDPPDEVSEDCLSEL